MLQIAKWQLPFAISSIETFVYSWNLPGKIKVGCCRASLYLVIIFFLWSQLAPAHAIDAEMIKDINERIVNPGLCSETIEFNGVIFFCARDPRGDEELWKYDPAGSGRVLVKNIYPDPDRSSRPHDFIDFGDTFFFKAGIHEQQLWRSDGTEAGTQLVFQGDTYQLTNVNGTLFFVASGGLWKSDGTKSGTIKLKDITRYYPKPLTNVNGVLFFIVDGDWTGNELWKTDGTEAGTVKVKNSVSPDHLVNCNGTLFFLSKGALWKSDGTEAGTVSVKAVSHAEHLTVVGDVLYFSASSHSLYVRELWKSDGTEAGTVLVKDVFVGRTGTEPKGLIDVNGALFFIADDGVHGVELWKSDGSEEGTVLVKDIHPGPDGAEIYEHVLTNVNGALFFWANDGARGSELWKTDGTESGTVLVKDVQVGQLGSGPMGSSLHKHASIGNKLFFGADDGINAGVLWVSDGTEAGTVPISYDGAHTDSSYETYFYPPLKTSNDTLYVVLNNGHGNGLWKTDGTEAGTALVKAITQEWEPISIRGMVAFNGQDYFFAHDNTYGLWKTDGTEKGTVKVEELDDIAPRKLAKLDNAIFFTLSMNGMEAFLAKSNGTYGSAELVKDFSEGHYGAEILKMQSVGSKLFIKVVTYAPGEQVHLWVVDSANENAEQLDWGGPYYNPSNFFEYKGQILFTAYGDLYQTDGTKAGTKKVENTNFPGGSNFMEAWGTWIFSSGENDEKTFWKFDGSPQKTVQITNVPGGDPIYVNGTLFFYHYDDIAGNELWKTDGTQAGTKMVKDIWPGSEGSYPQQLTTVNGMLFFAANDGVHGKELWMSDGTEEGTRLVRDIFPDVDRYSAAATVMRPINLSRLNDMLIFVANDGVHGHELWRVDTADNDKDGIADSADPDDDNDSLVDSADSCATGATGWTSNATTDNDGDGCQDSGEDNDDDNDGVLDGFDSCSAGVTGWISTSTTDNDGDGCQDNGEDNDDDNDGLTDAWEINNGLDPLDGICPSWMCGGGMKGWHHAIPLINK